MMMHLSNTTTATSIVVVVVRNTIIAHNDLTTSNKTFTMNE